MAGVQPDESGGVSLEDAIGIASFNIAAGRVPSAAQWVDGLIDAAGDNKNAAFAESFF